MWRTFAVASVFFAVALPALANDPREDLPDLPSKSALQGAFGSQENFVIRSVHRVEIGKSGEHAFLIPVWLTSRGRNFSSGVLFHRPKLKQTRLLDYSNVESIPYVKYLYGRLAILSSYSSGQGSEGFVQDVVQFDGWDVKTMASSGGFGNDIGTSNCTARIPCRHKTIIYQPVLGTGLLAKITLSGKAVENQISGTKFDVKLYELKTDALVPLGRARK